MPSNFLALNVPLVPLPEGSAAFEAGAAPPGGPGLPGVCIAARGWSTASRYALERRRRALMLSGRVAAGDEGDAGREGAYEPFARAGEGSDDASTSYRSDDADGGFPTAAPGGRGRGLWSALRSLLHVGHDAEGAVRSPTTGGSKAAGPRRAASATRGARSHLSGRLYVQGHGRCCMACSALTGAEAQAARREPGQQALRAASARFCSRALQSDGGAANRSPRDSRRAAPLLGSTMECSAASSAIRAERACGRSKPLIPVHGRKTTRRGDAGCEPPLHARGASAPGGHRRHRLPAAQFGRVPPLARQAAAQARRALQGAAAATGLPKRIPVGPLLCAPEPGRGVAHPCEGLLRGWARSVAEAGRAARPRRGRSHRAAGGLEA